jgi:hypothetical protein
MPRKKVVYEDLTCSRCGKTWTTLCTPYVIATFQVNWESSSRDGGSNYNESGELCKGCAESFYKWLKGLTKEERTA